MAAGSAGLDVTQSYGYDGLNRLISASEGTSWTQTYDYDRYGNRAVRAGSYMPQPQLTPQSASPTDLSAFNANTNRIALAGFGYDVSGNLTSDPTTTANAMAYDSENHLTSYTKSGVTTRYFYDGDGRRVKKTDGNGTTVFVYNVAGQMIAEYHSDPVPTPPGGGGTSYLTTDHLGSTRVVTKADGSVKARYDYLPYGEQIGTAISGRGSVRGYNGAGSTRQKFAQKERDVESGLDYFLARYYSSARGRFASVDREGAGANPDDAQSWNGYAYARNNPLIYVDQTGLAYDFVINGQTYRVNDATEFAKYGYKVVGGNDDGTVLAIQGANGSIYSAQFVDVPVDNPVQVYDQSGMTPLARGVFLELERRADASQKLIVGFAVVTYGTGAAIGAGAYFAPAVAEIVRRALSTPQAIRTIGQGLKNIRPIGSGRLANYLRGNTELAGGDQAARQLFQQLTGRAPAGALDRVVQGGKEIVYRATSTSGPSKIEIVDHVQRFLEKISFR